MRARINYLRDAIREGTKWLLAALGAVSLVTGVALIAVLSLSPWIALVLVLAALLIVLAEGAYRLHRKQCTPIACLNAQLATADRTLAVAIQRATADLTSTLRNQSDRAPGEEAERQRTKIRREKNDPCRVVHGDEAWQRETIILWRERHRTPIMSLAYQARDRGACSESEQHSLTETQDVPGLWEMVKLLGEMRCSLEKKARAEEEGQAP